MGENNEKEDHLEVPKGPAETPFPTFWFGDRRHVRYLSARAWGMVITVREGKGSHE